MYNSYYKIESESENVKQGYYIIRTINQYLAV